MTKKELVGSIAENNDLPKAQVETVMDSIFETFKEALAEGEKITVNGFGSFTPKERAARNGRNPQTGKAMKIPASIAVTFKPAAGLKAYVNS